MGSVESHKESARRMVDDIEEKIRKEIAVERQKLVGFACSEASCDLLAILLHKKSLIDPGFNVNHRFFASNKIARARFNFEFPSKDKLLPLFVRQEECRTLLCYGKPKSQKAVTECIDNFFKIKGIIEKETGEKI